MNGLRNVRDQLVMVTHKSVTAAFDILNHAKLPPQDKHQGQHFQQHGVLYAANTGIGEPLFFLSQSPTKMQFGKTLKSLYVALCNQLDYQLIYV